MHSHFITCPRWPFFCLGDLPKDLQERLGLALYGSTKVQVFSYSSNHPNGVWNDAPLSNTRYVDVVPAILYRARGVVNGDGMSEWTQKVLDIDIGDFED